METIRGATVMLDASGDTGIVMEHGVNEKGQSVVVVVNMFGEYYTWRVSKVTIVEED